MLVSFGAESVFDLLSVSSEQGRKQHFESGGGTYFGGGSEGSPPEHFERCRCNFPHSGAFTMFLDTK